MGDYIWRYETANTYSRVIRAHLHCRQTTAQNGARYPESFQIKKNGTTVLLEDYASAPRSAPSFAAAAAPPNDFEGLPR